MAITVQGFDWDLANLVKLRKHKVTQEEAEEIFTIAPLIDEGAYVKKGERRYRCLGVTSVRRLLASFFTIRKGLIRNISVRPMSRKERKVYEQAKKT